MRYLASFVVTLAWALWLGGLIALFLFVQTLFRQNRPVAVDAAPLMFQAFERVQLLLAGCALIGTFCLWLLTRARPVKVVFALLALSAALAALSTTLVTTKMESLRRAGMSASPEFRRLHGFSMLFYVSQAGVLVAAGAALPAAIGCAMRRRDPSGFPATTETAEGTAPA